MFLCPLCPRLKEEDVWRQHAVEHPNKKEYASILQHVPEQKEELLDQGRWLDTSLLSVLNY